MCFSAEASFGLGAVLVPAGTYCVFRALRQKVSFLPLAVLPVVFGVQQCAEGLVWVGINESNPGLIMASSLTFLFFALCFWLFWIPFTILIIEQRRPMKWFLGAILVLGLLGGLMMYVPLLLDPGKLTTRVVYHSIQYEMAPSLLFPSLPAVVWHALYLTIVATPLVTFRSKEVLGFGYVLILSAVVSHLVYWYAFESVWCFFAALLSAQLCVIFARLPAPSAVAVVPGSL